MFKQRIIYLIVAAGLLAGCGDASDHGGGVIYNADTGIAGGHVSIGNGDIILRTDTAPKATITAAGNFSIEGQPVAVNADERAQLQRYYRGVMSVREHGIVTGKLGAALAGQAISSVVRNLAQGNPDNIDKEVNPQADKVEQSAMLICDDLTDIKAAQDALAAQLPAFKPYAGIMTGKDENDCRDHNDRANVRMESTSANTADMTAFAGNWSATGTPTGMSDVVTTASAPQLRLVLPESLKLPDGRVFLLEPENANTYAVNDNGTRIAFALTSPGHADLSIKGHNDTRSAYLKMTLVK